LVACRLTDGTDSDGETDLLDAHNLPAFGAAAAVADAANSSPNVAAAAAAEGDAADAGAAPAAAAAAANAASLREAQQLGRLYRIGDKTQLPLRMTLRLLAAGQAQVAALYGHWMRSMDAWERARERSVKGLLDVVRTGEGDAQHRVRCCGLCWSGAYCKDASVHCGLHCLA
jgi:hypothetical protein